VTVWDWEVYPRERASGILRIFGVTPGTDVTTRRRY
jgi:hypothetical protein